MSWYIIWPKPCPREQSDDRQGGLIPIRSPRPAPGHYNLPNSAAVRLRESATFKTGSEPFGSRVPLDPSGASPKVFTPRVVGVHGRPIGWYVTYRCDATRFRAGTTARSARRECTYAYASPVQSMVTPTKPSIYSGQIRPQPDPQVAAVNPGCHTRVSTVWGEPKPRARRLPTGD